MNVRISQLPTAPSAITGAELVPIVQNGETVQATVNQLVSSPSQTQTFLTVNHEPTLPNSRYFGVGVGIGITDTGAQGKFSLFLNATSGSLEVAGYGLVAKTSAGTIAARTLLTSGAGLSVTNGDGISGNPTIAPTGLLYSLANSSGTGLLASNGSTLTPVSITGTANQISVSNGNTAPVIGIATNPVIPGNAAITLPSGNTASRAASPSFAMLRGNSDTQLLEAYLNNSWTVLASGSGVTSVLTGTGLTGGPITSTGTISIANTAVTAASYGSASSVGTFTVNAQGQLTAASSVAISIPASAINTTVPNSGLTNSSITINGNSVALGGSTTVTASTTSTLTIGTGLSGTSFNGSSPVTVAIANTGVTAGTYGSSAVIPVLTINAQGQVTSISTQASNAPAYQGTWNANTNVPTLTSSVGTAGYYYVVTTAGNTTLNGVTGWNVGDWAIFSNGAWQKIPGSSTESFTNLITTNLQVSGLTGFVYANNTTGYATAATTAQLLTLLGTTPVANGGTGLISLTAGSITYGNGTSAYNTLAIGTNGQILTSNGTSPQWSTLSGVAVTTFSGGATGLTPNTATSGAITLSGTLVVSNGGTGVATLTGLAYGNGTSAFTTATAAQVVSVIGSTAVTNATNASNLLLAAGSGATNYITFSASATGNATQYTNTGLTYNYTNNAITGGISGGSF